MAPVEMDSVLLRLREGDHVGVLKRTLKGGTELVHGNESITTAATIPAGHKIALKPVTNGELATVLGDWRKSFDAPESLGSDTGIP